MIGWLRTHAVPHRAVGLSLALLVARVALGGGMVVAGRAKLYTVNGACVTAPLPDCEKEGQVTCGDDAACKLAVPARCATDRAKACAEDVARSEKYFAHLTIAGRANWVWPGGGRLNLWLVAVAEALGGALVALGLFARAASWPLAFSMAVAMLTAHFDTFDMRMRFTGELAFCYLAMALGIAAAGPGRLSIDALWGQGGGPARAAAKPPRTGGK